TGFACGGASEPCDAQNRPYFRPLVNITRGEFAQALASVHRACVSPPIQLASDVVDLTGTGSDLVAVQLSYDPSLAQLFFGAEAGLRLGWLNTTTKQWVNAVLGNTSA
ncbi:MAG: hypothetical protein M3Y69_02210, partial [Verrucomicrobiota bacterium]|nr:hypothetical protein [Verrucomicrobiota bacterium]